MYAYTNPLNDNTIWFKDLKPTVKSLNIIPYKWQGLLFLWLCLYCFMYSIEIVFLICFIYSTYLNSLNSDTVWDKGIKTTVQYWEYYCNSQGLFLWLFLYCFYIQYWIFLVCFIYSTYLNSINSDTVWDKGIKTTVKYSEYYCNSQGLFLMIIPLLFLYTVLKMYCFI